MTVPVLTIDGPSGSGKSTLTYYLVQHLAWNFLNSGGLYRALAYQAIQTQTDSNDEETLVQLLSSFQIKFLLSKSMESDPFIKLFLNGVDITHAIATQDCAAYSSKIATLSPVRTALLQVQRDFLRPPGLIAEGRDMGTVVFPDAPLKFFLHASPEVRANRRSKQLKAMGIHVNLPSLIHEIEKRDKRDRERKLSPLKPASDAIMIDTTTQSVKDVLAFVLDEVFKKFSGTAKSV